MYCLFSFVYWLCPVIILNLISMQCEQKCYVIYLQRKVAVYSPVSCLEAFCIELLTQVLENLSQHFIPMVICWWPFVLQFLSSGGLGEKNTPSDVSFLRIFFNYKFFASLGSAVVTHSPLSAMARVWLWPHVGCFSPFTANTWWLSLWGFLPPLEGL